MFAQVCNWYEQAANWLNKNIKDVKRLYWSTYDIHNHKSLIRRHVHTAKDTAKTLHKYITLKTPKILHETDTSTIYIVPLTINHAEYRLALPVHKNSMSKICGAWGFRSDGRHENILTMIKKFAGPNETWLENLTPAMLGYSSIQLHVLDNMFELQIKQIDGDEKIVV
jgi:hypothetical protein